MANGWTETTLGELCDRGRAKIQTGPFGSQLHSYDYQQTGVPVVPTEGIGRRRLRENDIPRASEAVANRLSRHKLKAGDILFARRGAQATGFSALIEPKHGGWLCGTGAILLRLETPDVDATFLSFVLSSDVTISWLKAHAVGAVMPNLNEGVLRRLPLRLPPLSEQHVIAAVLGALDDKIELNRRMNETLEAMARALFQNWFVDATQAGLQKGWREVPLPEAIEVNPSRALRKGEVAPYLDMANMPTHAARGMEVYDREFGSGMRFMDGDTLVARITPCLENGKTCFVDFLGEGKVGWGSTEYIVLHPKPPLPPEFAYFLARTENFRAFAISNMTGTSGRQRVPADCLNNFTVVVPSAEIAERFGQFARALFAQLKAHDDESRTLAALRDALLPKLLSGELRVPAAAPIVEARA